jgi:hypothetical protein
MFRTQFYDPSIDPERREFYLTHESQSKSVSITVLSETLSSKKKRFFFARNIFLSIFCRFLMISYSILLVLEIALFFNEKIVLLNLFFLILMIADCLIVIFVRKGLEDRWCSLSILYFICANSVPLWMLEIKYGYILSTNIYSSDFYHHFESHYKQFNDSKTVLNTVFFENKNKTINADSIWLEKIDKEQFSLILEEHEALFCLILIFCRIVLPQATLTWGAISSLSEFSFNTILDIYFTISMCRDSKFNFPKSLVAAIFIISNCSLLPIALNIFPDSDSNDPINSLTISSLRRLTDNFYFRYIIQILLADLPFLILRLVILTKLKYVKKEIYYLIAKQVVILISKFAIMIYNWLRNFIKECNMKNFININNMNLID